MSDYKREKYGNGSDEILSDIRRTRVEMDETLEQLGNYLNPRILLDDTIERIRNSDAKEVKVAIQAAVDGVGSHVQRHPVSSFIFGAAAGMLVYELSQLKDEKLDTDTLVKGAKHTYRKSREGIKEGSQNVMEKVSDAGSSTKESIRAAGKSLKDKVFSSKESTKEGLESVRESAANKTSDATHSLQDAAGDLKSRGSDTADALKDGLHRSYAKSRRGIKKTSRNHPLAIGAGILAAGLLIGSALPGTSKEDRVMGHKSDKAVRRGRGRAKSAACTSKEVAKATVEAAKDQARNEGLTLDQLAKKASRITEKANETAREEIEDTRNS